jgi:hypothetical protein
MQYNRAQQIFLSKINIIKKNQKKKELPPPRGVPGRPWSF